MKWHLIPRTIFLLSLAGAKLPTDRPIDGHSYAGFLRGTTERTREWIFAFQADRPILRTQRWLLEDNSPLHWGRLHDCGESRNGSGYKDVTASTDPEVLAIKARFNARLETLPAPVLAAKGAPNERKDPAAKAEKRRRRLL